MPRLSEKELASIYPRKKTYDELVAERMQRQRARRPHLVSVKIGAWTMLAFCTVIIIYSLISFLMKASLSSSSLALFGASSSIFLGLIAVGLVSYVYVAISKLAAKSSISRTCLFTVLALIALVGGFVYKALEQNFQNGILTTILVLLITFTASSVSVNLIKRWQ